MEKQKARISKIILTNEITQKNLQFCDYKPRDAKQTKKQNEKKRTLEIVLHRYNQ